MEDKNKEIIEGEGKPTPTPEEIAAKELKDKEGAEGDDKDIDYKTELETLEGKKTGRSELDKAKFSAKSTLKRIAELGGDVEEVLGDLIPNKKKAKDDDDDKEDNKFATKDEFNSLVRNQTIAHARTLVGSDDELKLVMHHLENSIVRTGNMVEDVETAHLLANRSKIKRTMQEIARSNGAKDNAHGPSGAGQRTIDKKMPAMPQATQDILRKRGFTPNPSTGEWEAKFTKVIFNEKTRAWDTVKK